MALDAISGTKIRGGTYCLNIAIPASAWQSYFFRDY
jgi:hypothetical protein